MGDIDDALERADREHFTKAPPRTLQARIRFLLKYQSAKEIGQEIGVTADSVNRYRRGTRKHPPKDVAARIEAAVLARWQPQVRRRRQKHAATIGGITVETRARFGYTAPVGTTDDGRFRRLTVHLPAAFARRLFDAREAGADDRRMRQIIADGLRETYFQDGGRRATGLSEVEINDIDYLDLEF
ncbi:XRE family transcriptional regulator [Streptomyces sp. SKN60]|uniref:telomere-protecting terminal protein Tpg n=1 Tax=Streptomyces sp. SKN60 TaxID=2855506 RepID=UPI0022469183|nr:XRE family transcriptional regulator [Streptomyces sp. SKN60]MCX2182750.1 XRE family transcriptional regulator [Streptomyces sp. SKN60]